MREGEKNSGAVYSDKEGKRTPDRDRVHRVGVGVQRGCACPSPSLPSDVLRRLVALQVSETMDEGEGGMETRRWRESIKSG